MVVGHGEACGKLILLGEHFVVHGTPALALPLTAVSTKVTVLQDDRLTAPELVTDAPDDLLGPARQLLQTAVERLGLPACGWRVEVCSGVPLRCGLGSSAAYAVALLRALGVAAGAPLLPDEVNDHAYALEQLVHGTPSGIDNTTICYQRPLWFVKSQPAQFLESPGDLHLVLASSGQPGATSRAVSRVRSLAETESERFDELCIQAGKLALDGREAFGRGDAEQLGDLMSRNHALLQSLGVSTDALDSLTSSAVQAGAFGAKLTGGGCGGFAVAVTERERVDPVVRALEATGAPQVLRLVL